MNKKEIGEFLTLTALIDNRTITPEVALMWSEIIGHLSVDDAVAAMKAHYSESEKWLMPVHVLDRVRAKERLALPQTMSPEGKDCTKLGKPAHEWMDDGYCLYCEQRAF